MFAPKNLTHLGRQQQIQQDSRRSQLLDSLDLPEHLPQPLIVRPTRLPPTLNQPNPRNLPRTSESESSLRVKRSKTSTKPSTSSKVESKVKFHDDKQQAFELELEEMLLKVEKGWEADLRRKRESSWLPENLVQEIGISR